MSKGSIRERAKKVPQHIKDKVAKDIKAAKKMYGTKKPKRHWIYAIPPMYRDVVLEDFKKFWNEKGSVGRQITKWSSLLIAFKWSETEMGFDFYNLIFGELTDLGYK